MQRLNPKYIRIAGIILISLIVIVSIGAYVAYAKREVLLQKAIVKAKAKAKRDYNLDVQIGSAHFTGLSTIAMADITVIPQNRDSLLSIKKFDVSVKIFPLIYGTIKLSNVILQDGHLNLTIKKGVKNFDFLFKKKKDTTATSKLNLAKLADNLINEVLYKIPDNLDLKNLLITFTDDSTRLKLLATTALIKNGNLTSNINVNNGAATWHFAGKMHPSDKEIDVKLYADRGKVELPILEKKFNLKLSFDTIGTKLADVEHSNGETRIIGSWGVSNLLINHPKLSANDIIVPNGSIDANMYVGENYVSLDSSSVIHLKKFTAHPYIKYTLKPVKIYELKVNSGWQNAQDLFDSFPTGMFESLEGIKVAGGLNYSLNFYLNTKKPDDLKFDSRLDKRDFRILKFGKTDFARLNRPFVYIPYEHGKPMPPRMIGPSNPNFTPIDQISPNLINAVLTAEDPSFYRNHGFVEESIRKSIVTDFKEKKFKRGGSTISMQLVKNAFLSRQKTLSRKIEEIMIVWLIENNRIMTKSRMLEVYFNIIEWGRNVYGVGEAARYYFGKSPSELTLGESIFMASIVPKPKAGLYAFLPDGTLRPGLHGYFNLIGRLMASNGLTQRDTSAYGYYDVHLKESLRRQIAPVDTTTLNNILQQDDDENTPVTDPDKKLNFFQRLFGKRDTVVVHKKEAVAADTVKTPKQLREEKRELKRKEKELRKQLRDRGAL